MLSQEVCTSLHLLCPSITPAFLVFQTLHVTARLLAESITPQLGVSPVLQVSHALYKCLQMKLVYVSRASGQ